MSQAKEELLAQAQDPDAPLETLHQLAQNYPDLRPYIAANPRTYPALLEWLGTLEDPAVDTALAARTSGTVGGVAVGPVDSAAGSADSTQVLSQRPTRIPADTPGPTAGAAASTRPGPAEGASPADGHTVARTVGGPAGTGPAGTSVTSPPDSQAQTTQAIPAQPGGGAPRPVRPQPRPQPAAPPTAPMVPAAPAARVPPPPAARVPPPRAPEQPTQPAVPAAPQPGQPAPRRGAPARQPGPARRPRQAAAAAYTAAAPPAVDGNAAEQAAPAPEEAEPRGKAAVFSIGTADTGTGAPSGRFLWLLAAFVGALVVFVLTWFLSDRGTDPSVSAQEDTQTATAPQTPVASPSPTQPAQETATPSPTASTTPSATPSPELTAPAPDDAIEMTSFTSPSGNISCVLSATTVSCTINDYDFVGSDSTCSGSSAPFTASVGTEGEASGSCGQRFTARGESLEYGTSAKNDTFACTSGQDGIECWSQVTGQGFTLSRSASDITVRSSAD